MLWFPVCGWRELLGQVETFSPQNTVKIVWKLAGDVFHRGLKTKELKGELNPQKHSIDQTMFDPIPHNNNQNKCDIMYWMPCARPTGITVIVTEPCLLFESITTLTTKINNYISLNPVFATTTLLIIKYWSKIKSKLVVWRCVSRSTQWSKITPRAAVQQPLYYTEIIVSITRSTIML